MKFRTTSYYFLVISTVMIVNGVMPHLANAYTPQAERHRIATSGGTQQPPRDYRVHYGGMAWHVDAVDVWVDTKWYGPGGAASAKNTALQACNAVMGGGCKDGGSWSDSKVVIMRRANGDIYWVWGGGDGKSGDYKKGLAECSAQQPLTCEILGRYGSYTSKRHFPDASVRKFYAAGAEIEGEAYNNKLYIASGFNSLTAAQNAAMQACRQAAGKNRCKGVAWVGNGVIQTYVAQQHHGAVIESSSGRAQKAVKRYCGNRNFKKCKSQTQYDSRQSGIFVHDYFAGMKN
ncbi:hypothetical protein F2A31_09990 [Acinetobacter suaedae]|uniref:DUF4189 domain-containing protein n=1 Tax=Acinetobacter suaedae TaxID=2609668 RepID=A0A5P1USY7_9GAMM|nr:hypothetical protein [Acinetobacter sp. C16S1]QER40029.1 hypothetical protein F2A31_09990 [Acinetobacter sp. C16S1]